jgi:hypothetical protein
MTYFSLIKHFYRKNILFSTFALFFILISIVILLVKNGLNNYIINVISILFSYYMISMMSYFYSLEMVISGYWILIISLVSLFFLDVIDPLFVLMGGFGFGFIIAYILALIEEKKRD